MTNSDHPHGDLVLGVDIGTGGCKVCAVDGDAQIAGTATSAYETSTPGAGWAEQNPDDWMRAFADAFSELRQTGSITGDRIAGIALSSAAHIAVLIDRHGQPTRKAILWSDQRSHREVDELEAATGKEIYARTGNRVSTTWTLPHLAWIRRHDSDAWKRTGRILLSKDYVAYRLTGRMTTDPATALSSMLFDAVDNRWSPSLCNLLEISPDRLSEVLPVTAIAGSLTREAATAFRLKPGLPVINGTLDSAAETYGAGVASPGKALLRLASAGGIQIVHNGMHPHPGLITYPHPIRPHWFSQAGTNTCATAVKWAIRAFTLEKGASFEEWDAAAKEIPPGSEGLVFHPYLAGERCPHWNSRLKASFTGAALEHAAGHFARAVYEGTAFSIRDALGVLEEIAPAPSTLTAVGGGTKSDLWMRIVCDCLGLPLKVAPHADSSYGAALLGMTGLGWFKNPNEAIEKTATGTTEMHPADEIHRLYNQLFERYRDIHARLAPVYNRD